MLLDIILNFFKKTKANTHLRVIGKEYITGYFLADAIATMPGFFAGEPLEFYFLKLFRLVHWYRLGLPLKKVLGWALQNNTLEGKSKTIGSSTLMLYVLYSCHLLACVWILIGRAYKCDDKNDKQCIQSWVYKEGYEFRPVYELYVFSLYWNIEIITRVGYGEQSCSTSAEFLFVIMLSFAGLTLFSFLMSVVSELTNQ